ncbi:MAG: SHOCT domain-containing protein [Akkermansia sp.]|nr:SHOCT domain-containing protein [Akkermansia sp.]
MGLFTTEYCPVCGKKIGFLCSRIQNKIAVCYDCIDISDIDISLLPYLSVEDLMKRLKEREENLLQFKLFSTTREVSVPPFYFREDANMRRWYVSDEKNPQNPQLLRYDEIADYRIEEDGTTISSGGLGRALVGGVLFGGVGAVVGAVTGKKEGKKKLTSLNVVISLNNRYKTNITVPCIAFACKTGSWEYNKGMESAQKLMDFLRSINSKASDGNSPSSHNFQSSEADEILKFRNLMEQGIISETEFELKKKQILGI